MKITINCDECNKTIVSRSTLNRHKAAFHTEERSSYQCWHCHNEYARKESVVKHSLTAHNDPEKKFIITKITNTKYRPVITKPPRWTPPFEARPRTNNNSTIYRINLPSSTTSSAPATSTEDSPTNLPSTPEFQAYTLWEINRFFPVRPTLQELKDDLYLSSPDSDDSTTDRDNDLWDF